MANNADTITYVPCSACAHDFEVETFGANVMVDGYTLATEGMPVHLSHLDGYCDGIPEWPATLAAMVDAL